MRRSPHAIPRADSRFVFDLNHVGVVKTLQPRQGLVCCRMEAEPSAQPPEEHFFYHSFPRTRNSRDDRKMGLEILSLMCRHGFLLLAEPMRWNDSKSRHLNERPWENLAFRMSFTELEYSRLNKHAKNFGRFSLEFSFESMITLGAVPVSYIPIIDGGNPIISNIFPLSNALSLLGDFLRHKPTQSVSLESDFMEKGREYTVEQQILIKDFINEVFKSSGSTYLEIYGSLTCLMALWYPTHRVSEDGAGNNVDYYGQREWRLIIPAHQGNHDGIHRITPSQTEELLKLDKAFFGKIMPQLGGAPLCALSFYKKEAANRHVMSYVNRIFVPKDCILEAKTILKEHGIAVPVEEGPFV